MTDHPLLPQAHPELYELFAATVARPPDGEPVRVERAIRMRDGIELAADVHLPADDRLPAPAVVFGTPYDKSDARLALEARALQAAGYVAVVFDIRGRGKSEGDWRPFVNDPHDAHDVVEWAGVQDWCDGAVGISGLSYLGWIVWCAISERPPHLRAAISTSAGGRYMEEMPYVFGCFHLYNARWIAGVRRRIMDSTLDVDRLLRTLPLADIGPAIEPAGTMWEDFLDHDTLDDHWRALRFDGRYRDFDVPCLHVTGWHDEEDLRGAFHHYDHMVAESPAAADQYLVVGPWSHPMCRWPSSHYGGVHYTAEAAVDMTSVHLRFFDRYLRGEDNGVDAEPRVRLYDTGAKRWRAPVRWAAGVEEQSLFLADGAALAPAPGADGNREYTYDPTDPVESGFDATRSWDPPLDVSAMEQRPDVLVYRSAPLERAMTLHGVAHLVLLAMTDCDDTDWHARLTDVHEGTSLLVAGGCLRASYRESLSAPRPVTPGEVTPYDLELTPAFHTFAPGHRIGVTVTSSDFPVFARNLNRFGPIGPQHEPRVARNAIWHGERWPSRVVLPVEPPGLRHAI